MIEVKNNEEYKKYTNPLNESKVKQLCSYAMQEKTTQIASFYTYDFDNDRHCFSNIYCSDLVNYSLNVDDFYDRWNKLFDTKDYISNNQPFQIHKFVLQYQDLKDIQDSDTKLLYNQFLTILRLNSISDKPTAFIKLINLFLAKLADEMSQDVPFSTQDSSGNTLNHSGLRFQYVDDEIPESFMKRLNELYKDGMKNYLNKNVIDYTDTELQRMISGGISSQLMDVFDNLRLKKNNCFSFIEVYDDDTFLENFRVVKEIVRLLQNFKLKYNTKHQFLGDFFESLLNESLKQDEGQFFTPYPLVDFMVYSLDIKDRIDRYINSRATDFIPKIIDYACGAGHFLISSMRCVQETLTNVNPITTQQTNILNGYYANPYSWADEKHVVGIEKDYRLAKTSKIASFLNGDGNDLILAADGINRFDCKDYQQTILYKTGGKDLGLFDYVISNPPYSVAGFMKNFIKNRIDEKSDVFSLLDNPSSKDARIEMFFVERASQLLKDGGIAAIILPQSILTGKKYNSLRLFFSGKFQNTCHVVNSGYHIFRNDNESSSLIFKKGTS